MKIKNVESKHKKEFRQRAVELLRKKPKTLSVLSKKEIAELAHELSVYQIELEMQNEELRRVQHEIEESRSRYSDLYDFAPVGYLTLDKNGLITEINLTACQLFGRERATLIKKPFHFYVSKNSRDRLYQFRRGVAKTAARQNCELTLIRKDSSCFEALLESIRITDAQGNFTCRIALTDITERKQIEEQLQAHQANMAHLLRLGELGEMASGLAHEISQPLCAIENYAQACLRMMETKPNSPRLKDVIKDISDQAERAGKIVHRIKGLVRKKTPHFESAGIKDVILEAVELIHAEAKKRDVRVDLNIPDNLPTVHADFVLIEQVVLNLIRNGFDAMDSPKIHKKELTIQAQTGSNRMIQVCISDTGCGIPEENVKRIFESFFTTKPEGLGIGLPLSRAIVEFHSGKIWATANADGGMSFHFTLPTRNQTNEA